MQALGSGDNGVDVIVRAALPADAEAIAAVHVAGWRETYAGIMSEEALARASVERRALHWYRMLTESPPQLAIFVAERRGEGAGDGAIVGFAAGGKGRDAEIPADGEIHAIYMLRAHQRRGAGRALMRATAGALRETGHRAAYLWVLRENRPACAFYERLGGIVAADRIEDIAGSQHPELAYLWPNLATLAGEERRTKT
ncbi:MAG: GNAT family N-acetyltransferase [Bauldia sp.]|nr:GNAT family N-acetyltransferase [Bauldia sp.]